LEFSSLLPKSDTTGYLEPGMLVMFRYHAKTAEKLRHYDKNPLVMIVENENELFYGTNLHYYRPNERLGMLSTIKDMIEEGNGDWMSYLFGSKGFHKYLKSEVQSNFLNVNPLEWGIASQLPVEEFVRHLGGVEMSVNPKGIYE